MKQPLPKPAVGAQARSPGSENTAGSHTVGRNSPRGTICAIINPVAGGGRGRTVWSAIRAALIVAVGGDGTLHETLNGLMRSRGERRPALAFVPAGTANIFARALHLPSSSAEVARMLRRGRVRRIDVGQVNDRYYATIAGVGFDGEVVARASRWPRWGGGKTIHVAAILATLAVCPRAGACPLLSARPRDLLLTPRVPV